MNTITYNVSYPVLSIVGCQERAEEDDNGDGIQQSRLDEDADDTGQLEAPAHACDVLGSDAGVDTQYAVYKQA